MTVLTSRELPRSDLHLVDLSPSDLERLYALHEELHRDPDQSVLFVHESRDFFFRHLGDHGRVLGLISSGNSLVGYTVLGLPEAADPENFGRDLSLTAAERDRVAHLDGTGLRPAWRGLGLQRALIRERLRLCESLGRPITLSTVDPLNRWSLANLLAEGLVVVALVTKYSSRRFVLRRDLDHPMPSYHSNAGPRVPLSDTAQHQALLSAGWQGIGLVDHGTDGPCLVYGHPGSGADN